MKWNCKVRELEGYLEYRITTLKALEFLNYGINMDGTHKQDNYI